MEAERDGRGRMEEILVLRGLGYWAVIRLIGEKFNEQRGQTSDNNITTGGNRGWSICCFKKE